MNREKIKMAAAFAGAAVLLVNSVWIVGLKKDIRELENRIGNLENNVLDRISSLQSVVGSQYGDMERLLAKESSMLSDASLDFKLKGNKISVSTHVIPKELSDQETVFVRIYAGESIYEKETDADGRAEFLINMAENIRPVVLVKSESGVRQESLEVTDTGYLFEADMYTVWGEDEARNGESGKWGLTTWISSVEGSLPFEPGDVEKAEYVIMPAGVVVKDTGNGTAEAAAQPAPLASWTDSEEAVRLFDETEGERIPVIEMNGASSSMVGYYGDLSEFMARKDGVEYRVYFCLTTKDGTRFYTQEDSASTFMSRGNSSSQSCGYGRIVPVYPAEAGR